jgi:YgiT-type zinc finger domain-containing protein
MQQVETTYVQVYNGTLIHAPNVTAWKCDLCGATIFDPDAVRRVEVLAGEAGPPPNRHAAAHTADPVPGAEAPPADDPPDTLRPRSD